MPAKPWWESKTVWVNVLSVLVLALNSTDVISIFPPSWTPRLAGLLALANIVLRFVSSQPVTLTRP